MPNKEHLYITLTESCRKAGAQLVVVSKMRSIEEIQELYTLGQRLFAENRAQQLLLKVPLLPGDIEWHLIGHLQTNKVRAVLPHIHCLQSLDSLKLAIKVQEEAHKLNTRIRCLLQIKIAAEETKYGWDFSELLSVLQSGRHQAWSHIQLAGVMGMATLTSDHDQVRREMRQLKNQFDQLKSTFFASSPEFRTISMGMSGDYPIALEEGSTMVRVGSLLFPNPPS